MKVYKQYDFDLSDLTKIKEIIEDESVSLDRKKAIISLLKSYIQNLYCYDCKSAIRETSRTGKCTWNNDMQVNMPANDGPLERYYPSCPIRTLVTSFEKKNK